MQNRMDASDAVHTSDDAGDTSDDASDINFEFNKKDENEEGPSSHDDDDNDDDNDEDEDENDKIRSSEFVEILGWKFSDLGGPKKHDYETKQKFIMRTRKPNGKIEDYYYDSNQIDKDFLFPDGFVRYPENNAPKLDRHSLGWNASLIGKGIWALWRQTRTQTRTGFLGKVTDYNVSSEMHCVTWNDGDFTSVDLMHPSNKVLHEWKLCDTATENYLGDIRDATTNTGIAQPIVKNKVPET